MARRTDADGLVVAGRLSETETDTLNSRGGANDKGRSTGRANAVGKRRNNGHARPDDHGCGEDCLLVTKPGGTASGNHGRQVVLPFL